MSMNLLTRIDSLAANISELSGTIILVVSWYLVRIVSKMVKTIKSNL